MWWPQKGLKIEFIDIWLPCRAHKRIKNTFREDKKKCFSHSGKSHDDWVLLFLFCSDDRKSELDSEQREPLVKFEMDTSHERCCSASCESLKTRSESKLKDCAGLICMYTNIKRTSSERGSCFASDIEDCGFVHRHSGKRKTLKMPAREKQVAQLFSSSRFLFPPSCRRFFLDRSHDRGDGICNFKTESSWDGRKNFMRILFREFDKLLTLGRSSTCDRCLQNSPAKRILMRSSGWRMSVDVTPPG